MSQFIRKHVASSLLVSDTSTELSYILPSEAVKKGAFERLFQVRGLNMVVGTECSHRKDEHTPACIPWRQPHPASLQQLEHSLDALHLSSFGLMDTTLEEVFLKVSEEDQSLENSEAGKNAQG